MSYFRIDGDYWHAGGLDLVDTVAVIPLERSDSSSIITFVDVSDPEHPVRLVGHDIPRPHNKAGVCAMTPLTDGRLLLAVWTDSDTVGPKHSPAPFHLDLYRSGGMEVTSGFSLIAQFFPDAVHPFHRQHQSLDFLWQQSGGNDSLFLVGFENTSAVQPNPLDPGENKAGLFEVDLSQLPTSGGSGAPRLPGSFLTRKEERRFETSGNWCNMDAGACAYVDSNQQLIVYSVFHFLAPVGGAAGSDPVLKCLEFRATQFSPIDLIEDGWVELYEQSGLEGRRLAILGPWNASIQDTTRIFVDDLPFTVVRSARYQLPSGAAFVLYPGSNFEGGPALVLPGSGSVRELDVLGTSFPGLFGSCQLQQTSVAIALQNAIVDA